MWLSDLATGRLTAACPPFVCQLIKEHRERTRDPLRKACAAVAISLADWWPTLTLPSSATKLSQDVIVKLAATLTDAESFDSADSIAKRALNLGCPFTPDELEFLVEILKSYWGR